MMWKLDKGTKTGTATAAYLTAHDWAVSELGAKTMLLENTHATLTLKYKLLGYAVATGRPITIVAETTLSPAEVAEFHYSNQWDRLVLQVIDGSGHATYNLDYEGQGV
jgi:hypothetical protein